MLVAGYQARQACCVNTLQIWERVVVGKHRTVEHTCNQGVARLETNSVWSRQSVERRVTRLPEPAALARSQFESVRWARELSILRPHVSGAHAVDGRAVLVLLLQVKVVSCPKQP